MNPADRQRRLEDLFREASELTSEARQEYLGRACSGDSELRREVEELLAEDRRQGLLDLPVPQRLPSSSREPGSSPEFPAQIGEYRILGMLGEGGMGVVYRARQEKPPRTVALKLIRGERPRAELRRRFQRETEVLARLEHPGIARIYATGETSEAEGSRRFFAMECIEGTTLSDHVRERCLSRVDRLSMLCEVCDALQHAHERGVVHRDLKPGNVLVDAGGRPKVLDFGVARLTGHAVESGSLQTRTGELLGTLSYMSPEQVDPGSQSVDHRTDVYALGVMAYELVSGTLPFSVEKLSIPQASRVIAERDPLPLRALDPSLSPDLETIVHKAIAKSPSRRYQSAGQLREDLVRYLDHRPIRARPPSTAYQLRKLAQRHRGLVIGLAVAALVLVTGVVTTSVALVRALDAEADARRKTEELSQQFEKVATAKNVMDWIIGSSGVRDSGPQATLLDSVERVVATEAFHQLRDKQPEVRAVAEYAVGCVYSSQGEYAKAQSFLDSARELQRTAGLPEDHPDVLNTKGALALLLRRRGKLDEALSLHQEVHESYLQTEGPDGWETLQSWSNLLTAKLLLDEDLGSLQREMEDCVRRCRESLGELHDSTLTATNNLGLLLHDLGELERAAEVFETLLVAQQQVLPAQDPFVLTTRSNLGMVYFNLRRLELAEPLIEQALQGRLAVLGESHVETANSRMMLGELRSRQGAFAEARELLESAHRVLEERLGPQDPRTLAGVNNLAYTLRYTGDLVGAERRYREAIATLERVRGEDHEETILAMHNLAGLMLQTKRFAEAEELYGEVLLRAESLDPEHWVQAAFLLGYGRTLTALELFDEAEAVLLDARDRFAEAFGENHSHVETTEAELHQLEQRRESRSSVGG